MSLNTYIAVLSDPHGRAMYYAELTVSLIADETPKYSSHLLTEDWPG